MDKDFRIRLTAVDKATAVVRKVKNSFSQITRPITDMKSVVSSLGKETGLEKVGKSLLDIGGAASNLAAKMAGTMPLLGGGVGIATLAAMAGHWGDFGMQVSKTSQILDVSTKQLQEFWGAARRVAVAPDQLTAGMQTLGTTMEDFFSYRLDPEKIAALNTMNVSFRKTAKGAPDVVRGLLDIADATARISNPQAQHKFLNVLGLDQLFPLLSRGRSGIQNLIEETRQTGSILSDDDLRRAEQFKDSMVNLGEALGGVGNRLAANAGFLTDFNNAMARWIGGSGPSPFAGFSVKDALRAASAPLFPAATGGSLRDDINLIKGWWSGQSLPASAAPATAANSDSGPARAAAQSAGIYINAPPPPPMPVSSDASSPDGKAPTIKATTDAAAAISPKVSLEILLKNAPPGTTARARTSDGNDVPVRVQQSMPTLVSP